MTAFAELRAELSDLLVQLRGYGLMEPLRRDLDQCAAELMSECVVVVTGATVRNRASIPGTASTPRQIWRARAAVLPWRE